MAGCHNIDTKAFTNRSAGSKFEIMVHTGTYRQRGEFIGLLYP
jgi:hypothetical protein